MENWETVRGADDSVEEEMDHLGDLGGSAGEDFECSAEMEALADAAVETQEAENGSFAGMGVDNVP